MHDSAADHDQAVNQRHRSGDGVAGDLAHLVESLDGGLLVSGGVPAGYRPDLLWFKTVARVAGEFSVNPLHGADRDSVLDDDVGHVGMLEAEGLYARVVAPVKPAVYNGSYTKTGTESVAYKVVVAL